MVEQTYDLGVEKDLVLPACPREPGVELINSAHALLAEVLQGKRSRKKVMRIEKLQSVLKTHILLYYLMGISV